MSKRGNIRGNDVELEDTNRRIMMQFYRILAACAGWIGLSLFFFATVAHKSGTALIHGIINYFSYFTILSNIVVAVSFTFAAVSPRSAIGKIVDRPGVRTAIAVYIIVTGVVYLFLLSHLSPPGRMLRVANILLHYVVPVVYFADWLVFVPKGTLVRKQVLNWLAFPLLYAVYTLIHGGLTGFYPYFFLNVTKLGYPGVLLCCAFLLVCFILLGLFLVAIDRWMAKNARGRAVQSSGGP